MAVRDVVTQLIADVYSGKLQPRVAAGLAPLLNLQLRAIEATDQDRRISRLEEMQTALEQTMQESRTRKSQTG